MYFNSVIRETKLFTIFWTTYEVGDETSVWWVTNFCATHLITGLENRKIIFSQEVDFLKGVFSQNRYPEDLFTSCLRPFVNNKCDKSIQNSKVKEDRVETIFFIPYIGLPSIIFSQKLKELLKKILLYWH